MADDQARRDELRRRLAQAMREDYETCEQWAAVDRAAEEYMTAVTTWQCEALAPLRSHQRAVQAEATRLYTDFLTAGGDPADDSYCWPPRAPASSVPVTTA